MTTPLHLLLLEDQMDDAELVLRELRQMGFDPSGDRVQTEADFLSRLDPSLDVILSDYHLPGFDALRALRLLQESGMDVPFIIISGTAGEEMAVQALHAGATDYLLNDRLGRLEPTIKRAMEQRRLRNQMRVAEKSLRESEERFRTAFERAAVGMAITDLDGRFLEVNPAYCAIAGYSEQELLAMDLRSITHPDDVRPNIELMSQLLNGKLPSFLIEQRYLTKSGGIAWVQNTVALIRNDEGMPANIMAITQDVSERKRAEEALRNSEARLHAILNNSPTVVFLKDTQCRYLDINPQFERLFKLKREQILGKTDEEIFSAEQAALFRANDLKVLQSGKAMEFEEAAFCRGGHHTSIVVRFPLRDAGGNIYALCAIATDITDRKRAEEEKEHIFRKMENARKRLQLLSRRLVEVQEMERRRIARELHDEIGQGLTALKLTMQMAGRLPRESLKTALGDAQGQVGELLSRVRELSLDLRPAMLDDLGLLAALLWHFERYTAQTGIQVACKHSGVEGKRFATEIETAAYRIVQEALTNVARHARAKEVGVRLWVDRGTLAVQIQDKGVGFETDSANAGTSSGISGMRERASLLGGHLALRSSPGSGTLLTAELPLGNAVHRKENQK